MDSGGRKEPYCSNINHMKKCELQTQQKNPQQEEPSMAGPNRGRCPPPLYNKLATPAISWWDTIIPQTCLSSPSLLLPLHQMSLSFVVWRCLRFCHSLLVPNYNFPLSWINPFVGKIAGNFIFKENVTWCQKWDAGSYLQRLWGWWANTQVPVPTDLVRLAALLPALGFENSRLLDVSFTLCSELSSLYSGPVLRLCPSWEYSFGLWSDSFLELGCSYWNCAV